MVTLTLSPEAIALLSMLADTYGSRSAAAEAAIMALADVILDG